VKLEGKAKMLRVYFGEDDKWKDKPLYRTIVEKCRELDLAGATVFRGIEGYGASTLIHRSHLLSFSPDAPIRGKYSEAAAVSGRDGKRRSDRHVRSRSHQVLPPGRASLLISHPKKGAATLRQRLPVGVGAPWL